MRRLTADKIEIPAVHLGRHGEGVMNCCKAQVEEIIFAELVFT